MVIGCKAWRSLATSDDSAYLEGSDSCCGMQPVRCKVSWPGVLRHGASMVQHLVPPGQACRPFWCSSGEMRQRWRQLQMLLQPVVMSMLPCCKEAYQTLHSRSMTRYGRCAAIVAHKSACCQTLISQQWFLELLSCGRFCGLSLSSSLISGCMSFVMNQLLILESCLARCNSGFLTGDRASWSSSVGTPWWCSCSSKRQQHQRRVLH